MTGPIEMFDLKPFRPQWSSSTTSKIPEETSWFELSDALLEPTMPKQLYLLQDRDRILRIGNESGIAAALNKLGYHQPVVKVTTDAFLSRLTVSDSSLLDPERENIENFTIREDNYLIDVHTRPYRLKAYQLNAYQSLLRLSDPLNKTNQERLDSIVFSSSKSAAVAEFIQNSWPHRAPMVKQEWVCLQDPKAEFNKIKPRLPGQKFPGLGIGKLFLDTVAKSVSEKGHGMFFTPEHFHHGLLYQKAGYKFASPLMEGYFQAFCENLAPLIEEQGLAAVSWALGEGRIIDVTFDDIEGGGENRKVAKYLAQEQLAPISSSIIQYLESSQYKAFVDEAYSLARGKKLKIRD